MSNLAALARFAGTWYVSLALLGLLGLLLGSTVFFYVYPREPKIGVIDIPFTVISDNSAFEIGAMIDYARDQGSIKSVVIKLNSPGGSAAPSEHLFFELRKLRQKKPVVMVMDELVASGGYFMALGANNTYAKPSSFVGGVGVILSPLPSLIPRAPSERVVTTGPFKLEGGDRRHYVKLTEQLRQSVAQLLESQRGDKLKITSEQVLVGSIYSGVEAVRLGLVDAIGGQSDAIEKAAALAGIANYDLVDINTEVSRILNEKRQRIREPIQSSGEMPIIIDKAAMASWLQTPDGLPALLDRIMGAQEIDSLRRLPGPGGIGEDPDQVFPGLPLKINGPNVYYLYVGPYP